MEKWEYKIWNSGIHDGKEGVIQRLNELGQEGWEAAGVSFPETYSEPFCLQVVLKRKIKS